MYKNLLQYRKDINESLLSNVKNFKLNSRIYYKYFLPSDWLEFEMLHYKELLKSIRYTLVPF